MTSKIKTQISNIIKKINPNLHDQISFLRYAIRSIFELNDLKKIMMYCCAPVESNGPPKKIIFNLVRGINYYSLHFESVAAKALALRGHEVYLLLDDNLLGHCDSTFFDQSIEDCCNKCNFARKYLFKSMGGNKNPRYLKYSDLIEKKIIKNIDQLCENQDKIEQYKEIEIAPYILSSTKRHYRSQRLEKSKDVVDYKKKSLKNCLITLEIAESLQKSITPDIFITGQPVYSTWGPMYEYFRNNGVECLSYHQGCYKPGTVFNKDEIEGKNVIDKYWNGIKNKSLNEEQKLILNSFMRDRFEYKSIDHKVMSRFRPSSVNEEQMKLDLTLPTYGIFPNMLWESSLIKNSRLFDNVLDWISETVEYFKAHKEKNLIIKLHPGDECYFVQSSETVGKFILERYPDIEKWANVFILRPKTKIKAYDLFPLLKAGIVYNGTLGMEMAYKKLPVIVVGDVHYTEKGFIYDIKNKSDYFSLLENVEVIDDYQKNGYDNLLRFLFINFIQRDIPLNFLYGDTEQMVRLNGSTIKDIKPGANKLVDYFCECIVDQKKSFEDWYYEANNE